MDRKAGGREKLTHREHVNEEREIRRGVGMNRHAMHTFSGKE